MNSISQTKICKKLITSQRQAVMTLIEKKDKSFIKNWRPISLLNVDYKIISKVFSARPKKVLPQLFINNIRKIQFGTNFIDWIKIFLNKQESCVINGGVTT